MRYANTIFLALSLLVGFAANAQQPAKEELQRRTQDLLKEIEGVKQNIAATQKDKKQTLGLLRGIERKIDMREGVINNIKGEVYYVEKDIIRTYRDIDTLKKELTLLKVQYAQSVIYAYKNRSNYNFLNFMFSSANFGDVLRRIAYLKTYRSFREKKAGDIARTQSLLQGKVSSLTGKREEKSKALNEQTKQMAELESEKKEKDVVISQLKNKEGELVSSLKKKEAERKKIQNAIAAVIKREKDEAMRRERERLAAEKKKKDEAAKIAAANAAATKPTTTKPGTTGTSTAKVPPPVVTTPAKPVRQTSVLENTPDGLIVSQNFEQNKGSLPWPVSKGEIYLHYGDNRIPGKTREIVVHSDGISIETDNGTPVKAIFDGEVMSVTNIGDKQLVILRHGKYFTTYSNLASASVGRGQKVSRGQTIGVAGTNDDGVGSVDLQIDTERGTINPEAWIKRR